MAVTEFHRMLLLGLLAPGIASAQVARVQDSAGVRIVSNGLIAHGGGVIRLSPVPIVQVGGTRETIDEELDEYGGPISGLRLSDGRLVVADGTRLKFFDTRGRLVSSAGRSGSGPGEFRRAGSLCRFGGDSILVWDAASRRVSIWTATGTLAREYLAPYELQTTSCLGDGSVLVGGSRSATARPEAPMATYPMLLPTGQLGPALGPWPAMLLSGSMIRHVGVALRGDRIYFGDAQRMEYRVHGRTGRLVMIVRAADRPVPVTTAALKARPMMCMKRSLKGPCEVLPTTITHWPSYYQLEVDGAGNVWLWTGRDETRVWTVFGPDGVLRGQLPIRKNEAGSYPVPVHFGLDEVTLLDHDADGAVRLSVRKVIFPGVR